MQLHIFTLFVVVIVVSALLAGAIALVAYRRKNELFIWSGALVLHTATYVLFGLRGVVPDFVSVVVANTLLATTLALFAVGVFRFQRRPVPQRWIWGPALALFIVLPFIYNDIRTRTLFNSPVFVFECLLCLVALWQRRRQTPGRGQYLLMTSVVFTTLTLAVRWAAVGMGLISIQTLTDSNTIQSVTFLSSVISVVLMSFGVVMMDKERTEDALLESKRHGIFRSQILAMLANAEPQSEVLTAIVQGVETLHPRMLCSLLLLSEDGHHLGRGIAPSLPDFYNQAIEGLAIGPGVGSCGTAAFSGERVVVEDIASHPYWAPFKALAARAGLGACWSQPIHSSTHQVLGTFAIYHHQFHAPEPSDIALIEEAAHLASIAIEHSTAAEKLRASEAHYRTLIENLTEIVWRQSTQHCVTYISLADEHLRGFKAEEVIGRPWWDTMTEEGAAIVRAAMEHQQPRCTTQMRCKDGSTLWVEVTISPELDAQGNVVGYQGVGRDVTQRVQIQRRLQESEERYRLLVTQANEGISVVQDGQLCFANPKLLELVGYNLQEVKAKPFGQFVHPDDRALVQENYQRRLDGVLNLRYQIRLLTRHRGMRWFEINGVRIEWQGKPAALAFMTDVTERRQMEQEIWQLAYHDALTKLPNRRLLSERLQSEMTRQKRNAMHGALLFLDLDNFKPLNDQHGHKVGDLLLIEVAQRLTHCVREMDTVARFGGDEFVVMLCALSSDPAQAQEQARNVGQKVLQALSAPYALTVCSLTQTPSVVEHRCSASIGVLVFQGDTCSEEDLIKRADIAMYQAKESGRNALCIASA
ncbi:MAG: diguanylate cyclase [Burkholderiaceae bacterium]|nr:diguanylate cyclase [Burkholderiaceae bacterium]